MSALALMLRSMPDGWAVYLTDGRELVRYRGPGARWRALRYLARNY
jgi:hypothetical protein